MNFLVAMNHIYIYINNNISYFYGIVFKLKKINHMHKFVFINIDILKKLFIKKYLKGFS